MAEDDTSTVEAEVGETAGSPDDPFQDVPATELREYVNDLHERDPRKLAALMERSPTLKRVVEEEESAAELQEDIVAWMRDALDDDEGWLYRTEQKAAEVTQKRDAVSGQVARDRHKHGESYLGEDAEDEIAAARGSLAGMFNEVRDDLVRGLADEGHTVSAAFAGDVLNADFELTENAVNRAVYDLEAEGRVFEAIDLAGMVESDETDYFRGHTLDDEYTIKEVARRAIKKARSDGDPLKAAEIGAYVRSWDKGPSPDAGDIDTYKLDEVIQEDAQDAVRQAWDAGEYAEAVLLADEFDRYIHDENLQPDSLIETALEHCVEENRYRDIRHLNRAFGEEYEQLSRASPVVAEAYAMEGTSQDQPAAEERRGFLDRILG